MFIQFSQFYLFKSLDVYIQFFTIFRLFKQFLFHLTVKMNCYSCSWKRILRIDNVEFTFGVVKTLPYFMIIFRFVVQQIIIINKTKNSQHSTQNVFIQLGINWATIIIKQHNCVNKFKWNKHFFVIVMNMYKHQHFKK